MSIYSTNVTSLTGVSPETLALWLADAQAAMATLMSGGKVVSVSYEGKSVTYSQASLPNLLVWISQLQTALGLSPSRRRAIRPYFR